MLLGVSVTAERCCKFSRQYSSDTLADEDTQADFVDDVLSASIRGGAEPLRAPVVCATGFRPMGDGSAVPGRK